MIKNIVIDQNGLCNAKCWFCPVAYSGNPKKGRSDMPIKTLDNILKQLKEGVGDYVSDEPLTAYPNHFNEILLYPYFEDLVNTYNKYDIKIMLYSNGVNLTPDKVDIINKNPESISRITLNIPSAFKDQWSSFTGMNAKIFDKLINNLEYAYKNLSFHKLNKKFHIVVNGINEKSYPNIGGWTMPLKNIQEYDLDEKTGEVAKTVNKFKSMFPEIGIGPNIDLEDRAGILEKFNVISNKMAINLKTKKDKNKVIGCYDNRFNEWIHISATGDVFICCEDFYFETSFGNVYNNTIKEIWYSKEHLDMIKSSMLGMCTKCSFAKWGY